jgi:hypothetical protein
MAAVDVIGSTPVSFTNAEGAQKVVSLSALQFNGSDLQVGALTRSIGVDVRLIHKIH